MTWPDPAWRMKTEGNCSRSCDYSGVESLTHVLGGCSYMKSRKSMRRHTVLPGAQPGAATASQPHSGLSWAYFASCLPQRRAPQAAKKPSTSLSLPGTGSFLAESTENSFKYHKQLFISFRNRRSNAWRSSLRLSQILQLSAKRQEDTHLPRS